MPRHFNIGNIAGSSGFVATLATPEGFGFLLVLFGTGAVFAAMMFALIALSLPWYGTAERISAERY